MLKNLAISVVLAGAAITAQAQQEQTSGGYVGASIGRSSINPDDPAWPAGVAGNLSRDKSSTGWRVLGGYQFNENWALEGGYLDWGETNGNFIFTAPLALAGTQITSNAKADGVFADAIGIIPLSSQFGLMGRIGAAYTTLKASATTSNAAVNAALVASGFDFTPEHSEWNGRIGIGGQYNFSKSVGMRIEWERTFAVGDKDKTGEADIDYVSMGIRAKF